MSRRLEPNTSFSIDVRAEHALGPGHDVLERYADEGHSALYLGFYLDEIADLLPIAVDRGDGETGTARSCERPADCEVWNSPEHTPAYRDLVSLLEHVGAPEAADAVRRPFALSGNGAG